MTEERINEDIEAVNMGSDEDEPEQTADDVIEQMAADGEHPGEVILDMREHIAGLEKKVRSLSTCAEGAWDAAMLKVVSLQYDLTKANVEIANLRKDLEYSDAKRRSMCDDFKRIEAERDRLKSELEKLSASNPDKPVDYSRIAADNAEARGIIYHAVDGLPPDLSLIEAVKVLAGDADADGVYLAKRILCKALDVKSPSHLHGLCTLANMAKERIESKHECPSCDMLLEVRKVLAKMIGWRVDCDQETSAMAKEVSARLRASNELVRSACADLSEAIGVSDDFSLMGLVEPVCEGIADMAKQIEDYLGIQLIGDNPKFVPSEMARRLRDIIAKARQVDAIESAPKPSATGAIRIERSGLSSVVAVHHIIECAISNESPKSVVFSTVRGQGSIDFESEEVAMSVFERIRETMEAQS